MCNINLIYRKDGMNTRLISTIMNTISFNSWKGNHDGEGFIGLNRNGLNIVKSREKIKYEGQFYFLSSHQRLATTGEKNKGNSHPYETKHLILQHNGMFNSLGDKSKSDSKEYIDILEDAYVESGKDIIQALRKVHKKVYGWYSIVLYEKERERVLYYRNGASIYKVENDNWLSLSTKEENVEYVKWYLGIKGDIEEVEADLVYDVFDGFSVIGKVEPKEFKYVWTKTYSPGSKKTGGYNYSWEDGWSGLDDYDAKEEDKKESGTQTKLVSSSAYVGRYCDGCGVKFKKGWTVCDTKHSAYFCSDKCWKSWLKSIGSYYSYLKDKAKEVKSKRGGGINGRA